MEKVNSIIAFFLLLAMIKANLLQGEMMSELICVYIFGNKDQTSDLFAILLHYMFVKVMKAK